MSVMVLTGKAALVTGGSSGIGRAAAIALAREGALVLVSDVDGGGGADTVQMIEEAGGIASYITADVSNAAEVKTMMDAIVERYGKIDIAVNNAGVGGEMNPLPLQSEETFDQVMSVNVKGVWLCMQAEIPLMQQNEFGGSIVNIASVAGLIGAPGLSIYSASKHAVIGLTKTAAIEFASKGVRVNAVCPSFINTPMVSAMIEDQPRLADRLPVASPMRRLGTPEEVAEAIVWLASSSASFVNGVALAADGGLTAM
ncbi:MAG: glucose 1-dehydrogenase [Chloroflexota bacterium]